MAVTLSKRPGSQWANLSWAEFIFATEHNDPEDADMWAEYWHRRGVNADTDSPVGP